MAWGPTKMNPLASDPLFWRIVTGGGEAVCAPAGGAATRPDASSAARAAHESYSVSIALARNLCRIVSNLCYSN